MKKVVVYFISEKDKFVKTFMNIPTNVLNQPKADMLYDIGMLLYQTKKVPMANLVAYKLPSH